MMLEGRCWENGTPVKTTVSPPKTTEQWCKLLMSVSGCVIHFCKYQVFWQHRHDFYLHTFLGRVFMEGLAFHYLSFHNIKLPFAEPHSSEAGRRSNEVSILTILPKETPLVKVTNDLHVAKSNGQYPNLGLFP